MPAPRSESAILAFIRRAFPSGSAGVSSPLIVGMGDDAAIIRIGRSRLLAISTDAFLEGNHFLAGMHSPQDIGYKALARAVSDLAAVGATPCFFTMNLALPEKFAGAWLAQFLAGMAGAARRFGITLMGGDTTRPLLRPTFGANFTVFGELNGYPPVLRGGARPGDTIFLSGVAGAAQLGWELLRRGGVGQQPWRALLRRHLRPEPRLALGQWLARRGLATAMIDTSDGLSTDLKNLCAASKVGARIRSEDLPVVKIPQALRRCRFNPREMALHGGDDYELLFTVAPRHRSKIPRTFQGVLLTHIGCITRDKKILLEEGGKGRALPAQGWDPFR